MVDASFMQTLWNMNPISSGCELAEGTRVISYFSLRAHTLDSCQNAKYERILYTKF